MSRLKRDKQSATDLIRLHMRASGLLQDIFCLVLTNEDGSPDTDTAMECVMAIPKPMRLDILLKWANRLSKAVCWPVTAFLIIFCGGSCQQPRTQPAQPQAPSRPIVVPYEEPAKPPKAVHDARHIASGDPAYYTVSVTPQWIAGYWRYCGGSGAGPEWRWDRAGWHPCCAVDADGDGAISLRDWSLVIP